MGELSSNYVNFTLLNWEVWKVVNNISQKPKRYIQVTLLKMIYICVCVCVCVYQIIKFLTELPYLRSVLFRHSMCLASRLQSLDLRAFGTGGSQSKVQARTNQRSKPSAYQSLWTAGPDRHSRESSSDVKVTRSCAKSAQWREQRKDTFLGTDLPLNFSN